MTVELLTSRGGPGQETPARKPQDLVLGQIFLKCMKCSLPSTESASLNVPSPGGPSRWSDCPIPPGCPSPFSSVPSHQAASGPLGPCASSSPGDFPRLRGCRLGVWTPGHTKAESKGEPVKFQGKAWAVWCLPCRCCLCSGIEACVTLCHWQMKFMGKRWPGGRRRSRPLFPIQHASGYLGTVLTVPGQQRSGSLAGSELLFKSTLSCPVGVCGQWSWDVRETMAGGLGSGLRVQTAPRCSTPLSSPMWDVPQLGTWQ